MNVRTYSPRGKNWCLLATIVTLICGLVPGQAVNAEDRTLNSMHWAFSAFFGTGWYEVSDSKSVFVMRVPLQQTWRHSNFDDGQRQPGIEFHYPLTLGLQNVDEFDDFVDSENFGTVAFTPGVEFEIPVSEKWYLRPLVHFGWGEETDGGDSAWIYYGGVKSRYTPGSGRRDWSLLNALYYAGYSSREGGSGSVSTAMMGAEFHHPIKAGFAGRGDMQLNWHVTYSWMFDPADFGLRGPRSGLGQTVNDQWELGLALAPRGRSFKFWFMTFEQLGLSFRSSSDGDYRAIAINFSSPFY